MTMMWHRSYGPAPWGLLFLSGVWILLLICAVGVVIWLVARRRPRAVPGWAPGWAPTVPARPATGALAILDERLARGEVDVATYRMIRAELVGPPAPAPSGDQPTT